MRSAGEMALLRVFAFAAAVLAATPFLSAQPATKPAEELDPAIDVILSRIEKARADLPPLSYFLRAHEEWEEAGKVSKYDTSVSMVRNGGSQRCERSRTIDLNGEKQTINSRVLLTPNSFILMNLDEPVIKEWQFKHTPPDVVEQVRMFCHPDVLKWGFGNGNKDSLRESILSTHVKNKYVMRVVAVEDQPKIELDLIRVENQRDRRIATYTIDPKQGYLVTRKRTFDETGELIGGFDVECMKLEGDVWFPQRVEDWTKGSKTRRTRIEVTSTKRVNPGDQIFELSALKPNEGARVLRIREDGSSEMFIVRDGTPYPAEVIERLKR